MNHARAPILVGTVLVCLISSPVSGQQDAISALRAEVEKQQLMIDQLLLRLSALEKREVVTVGPAAEDVRADIKAQTDAVDSLRETVTRRVNLNGYYNFRFSADGSETPVAFQQHHLGIILGKQLGRFNVLTELELQNVPHHAQVESQEPGEDEHSSQESDTSGEGQVAVENAWMEYSHNRYLGVLALIRFGGRVDYVVSVVLLSSSLENMYGCGACGNPRRVRVSIGSTPSSWARRSNAAGLI